MERYFIRDNVFIWPSVAAVTENCFELAREGHTLHFLIYYFLVLNFSFLQSREANYRQRNRNRQTQKHA